MFQRQFVSELRRCEEMERQLSKCLCVLCQEPALIIKFVVGHLDPYKVKKSMYMNRK